MQRVWGVGGWSSHSKCDFYWGNTKSLCLNDRIKDSDSKEHQNYTFSLTHSLWCKVLLGLSKQLPISQTDDTKDKNCILRCYHNWEEQDPGCNKAEWSSQDAQPLRCLLCFFLFWTFQRKPCHLEANQSWWIKILLIDKLKHADTLDTWTLESVYAECCCCHIDSLGSR